MPDIKLTAAKHRKHANRIELHIAAPDVDLAEVPGLEVNEDGHAVFTFAPHPPVDDGETEKTQAEHDADCAREAALLVRHHVTVSKGKGRKLSGEGKPL